MQTPPSHLTLQAPITKFLGPLAIVVGLSAFGFYQYNTEHSTVGLIAGVLAAIGALFVLVQLLPNANALKLDESGLTIRAFYRDQRYNWKDIEAFQVGKIGLNEMVLFNLTAEFKSRSEADRAASEFMRNINGYDGALPTTYGKSASELCLLLRRYLQVD